MGALDGAMVSKILNALTPNGAAGIPGTALAALNAAAMFLKLTSSVSSEASSGTELTSLGQGYVTNGLAFSNAVAASAAGSAVTAPATAAMSWTFTGGYSPSIYSLEITDHVQVRVWYGNWNGAPIVVSSGNTFQIAVAAINISLT